jgi:CRISPR-associated helicase Cas3, subtype Dpsyc/CRISPR-associated helicase Cas3, subtype Dpsyc
MFDFRDCFERLTGNEPFEWQERLFQKFLNSDLPDACDVPTGLGKTSVMTIWLIALGCLLKEKDRKIPLRLVYVVDRRVIVDQATDEAERLLDKLMQALSDKSNPLHFLAQTFREASMKGNESLIALSTLRGQKADNREWCLDPSRPAIIIGTVDMIGSRLLFSGYGKVGINHRSLQAGLLGQDTLVVIDEAHLSPVFVSTLLDIKCAIYQTQSLRPFHVMSLSATLSGQGNTLEIDEQRECQNEKARLRLHAKKQIEWLPFDQTTKAKEGKKASRREINEAFAECLVKHAIQYEGATEAEPARSIVIFVKTVDLVNLIYDKLCDEIEKLATKGEAKESTDKKEKKKLRDAIEARILKMTGEMRGAERNDLVKSPKFKVFLPRSEPDRKTYRPTHYLIATSCAEVGVNLDADHGLCDLSTLDSMIQRIGRINRFGITESTITVMIDEQGLNAVASDLQKDEEHQRLLVKLSAEKDALQDQLAKGQLDKAAKKELQKQIGAKNKDTQALEKKSPKYEFENIDREDEKVYFTWKALKSKADENGKVNASPLALRGLLTGNKPALPDIPVRPPFDEARVDDWAMTSLKQKEYPRPLVQYWLRGVIDDERAQTTFVWRIDLDHFDFSNIPKEKATEQLPKQLQQAEELATMIPIQPQERANLATFRAEKLLKELAKKFPDKPIVLIDPSGEEKGYSGDQLKEDRNLFSKLAFSTVILPCSAGGLDADGNPLEKLPKEPQDVADVVSDEWTRYLIHRQTSKSFERTNLRIEKAEPKLFTSLGDILREAKDDGIFQNSKELQQAFANDEEKVISIAYFQKRSQSDADIPENPDDTSSLKFADRSVREHDEDVERYARFLAEKIGLPNEIAELLAAAGFRHDLGKDREWWQKAIGNLDDFKTKPLAKSRVNSFDHSFNQGYRHEFGSLVESLVDEDLKAHSHRDLILHLIAAHHGYARPHFPERAFDRNQPKPENQRIAHDVMLRFNHLQREYGWWQLAYLEAVLKAADAMASRDFSRGEL